MLLLHQTGSVKIGEVVRYTITYTPANDRILPSPPHLYLKIKNASAIPLRAAFVHGPYTLYVSSCPSNFQTNEKLENPRRDGVPEFEPNLKAGAAWQSKLSVSESIRETAGSARSHLQHHTEDGEQPKSVSWIIEVVSQVIFSNSAAVRYEILLGRDEKSLSLGFGGLSGGNASANGVPGQVSDHQQSQGAKDGHHSAQPKGVFSRAIMLKVDDTASLWNTPKLPEWDGSGKDRAKEKNSDAPVEIAVDGKEEEGGEHRNKRQKKVHLVVITHGLHSNLGADMLYLKESIDAATKQAKEDAKVRRAKRREEERQRASSSGQPQDTYHKAEREDEAGKTKAPAEQKEDNTDEAEDDEEVIVRGFSGNAVRTEKGIKYLGKRLAKYVLAMTYPDQPFKPITRTPAHSLSATIKIEQEQHSAIPVHSKSTVLKEPYMDRELAYKITSISFIAHSLGGLIQTYAIAYVQKHSPHFFELIRPINFITLATPFLGLSNENPLYVKFALDFGLVGRTGQDLGLTWRAPTLARSGWGAIVGGIGESAHKKAERQYDPGAKPLLRILPTGPAHAALKKFRNRTVYSNVVNDGIVPLRTSCLLFLDWQGLGRVEKARRENGLVGTMAGWGWAELTGSNARSSPRPAWLDEQESVDSMDETDANTPTRHGKGSIVPQPYENEANDADDNTRSLKFDQDRPSSARNEVPLQSPPPPTAETTHNGGALESLLSLFRSNTTKSHNHTHKHSKIYRRSQTVRLKDGTTAKVPKGDTKSTSGETAPDDPNDLSAPPKTTFFESAGDILNPPIPPVEFLIDPSARPRTIFHDRVYHPDDIPPPPLKRKSQSSLAHRISIRSSTPPSLQSQQSTESENVSLRSAESTGEVVDGSAMKVEEKIARAYHRDLSWRKVLVRLEPDAHNNMIVRRRFANAYGWPVVKHLVDTHFSDQAVANRRDDDEGSQERAKSNNERLNESGDEIKKSERGEDDNHGSDDESAGIRRLRRSDRSNSEELESTDHVPALASAKVGSLAQTMHAAQRPSLKERQDSAQWSDGDFMDSEGDSDAEPNPPPPPKSSSGSGWNWTEAIAGKGAVSPRLEKGTRQKDINNFLGKSSGADGAEEHSTLAEDAATAPQISEGAGTVGLGRSLSAKRDGSGGMAEQVARMSLGAEPVEQRF
jgi:hypothetical protein